MPGDFDPYYTWLGIPPAEQPADHYRLLGIPRLETNPDVISNAADARMAFLRTFQSGAKGHYTQRILNELAVARTTLLNEPRKAAYDQQLQEKGAHEQGMSVIPVAEPQPDPHQQQAMLELQRQLESVRAREQSLAQQQAQYAAALAQAEAMRQAQAQHAAAMRQREAQVAATAVAVRPAPAAVQSDPFAGLATIPALTVGRPQKKKSPWGTIPLPLLIAGLAVPALLVLLLVGYLATRGGGTTPTANIPSQPPVVPIVAPSLDKTPPLVAATPSQPGSTSPEPAPANPNDAPWRWARFRGDIASVVLSPEKDKAIFFASRKTGENMLLVDMATGDLVKRANAPDEGVEESSGQALGPGPRYTVAYLTPAAGKTKLQHLVTMPQPDGQLGMSVMVSGQARMAFSSQHPLWAHSDGAGDAGVVIRSTNDVSEIDRIRPPQGLEKPLVERMVDDGKYLLIEYTGQKKAGTQTFDVHRIVTYDWESRQPRQTCDLSAEEASGMRGYADAGGLKLQNEGLLVWGRGKDVGATGWFKFPSGDGFWSSADNSSPTLTVVDVLTGPKQLYLMLDTATNTLLVRPWDFRSKDISKLQYSSTIEEARFVDGGRGVLVLPRSSDEPILCWDVEQLNKAQTIAAPQLGDVGLVATTPGLNRAAKAAQASTGHSP